MVWPQEGNSTMCYSSWYNLIFTTCTITYIVKFAVQGGSRKAGCYYASTTLLNIKTNKSTDFQLNLV